jgi:hypothetical protein
LTTPRRRDTPTLAASLSHKEPAAMTASLDRRRFLQLGAAAAGLAAAPGLLSARDSKDADPFGGFTLGAQSYTFRNFDLEGALKRIKDLGLHYVEFYQKHCPVTDDDKKVKAVLALCKDYDITPLAFGVQGIRCARSTRSPSPSTRTARSARTSCTAGTSRRRSWRRSRTTTR